MTDLQERIIEVYETELKHPSLMYIAKAVGCSKKHAFETIRDYKAKGKKKPSRSK